MKKTAYLTPEIWEIGMEADELLAYSVTGEDVQIDNTVDDPDNGIDNRSRRRASNVWEDEELDEFEDF